MANIETEGPVSSGLTVGEDESVQGVTKVEDTDVTAPPANSVQEKAQESSISTDSTNAARPLPATVVPSSTLGLSAPHPKRFSTVNINKKFLEKNSSASGSTLVSSSSPVAKSGGPTPRPPTQTSLSHSRLVTTKLTTAPTLSSTTGPGWSRPSSAAPTGPSPSGSAPAPPTPASTHGPLSAAPQLPHAGNVIQPQSRAAVNGASSSKDGNGGSNKPVWGNVKATVPLLPKSDSRVQNDFPTAAEVAQVATSIRKAKILDNKEAAETAAANKQARIEEADTFRGVHLDPKAHHWDEMEEDDDNFLDGVIEFGDGRQYKIPSAELAQFPHSRLDSSSSTRSSVGGLREDRRPIEAPSHVPNAPVSKAERFADDFDRSWPRSKTSPALSTREFPPTAHHIAIPASPIPPQAVPSPQESSRVLFNERSNKLEPYSTANAPLRPGSGQHVQKRGSSDVLISSTEPRGSRDAPGHSSVQLLQKPGADSLPPRPRDIVHDTYIHIPPQSPHMKDGHSAYSPSASSSIGKDRDWIGERGRRTSTMGPPPVPPHAIRHPSWESARQLPPHLSQVPPSPIHPQRRMSSRESHFAPSSVSGPPSIHSTTQSPVLSHSSAVQPELSPQISGGAPVDLEEVRKDVMHNAAARAKQRRQQEEEERQKAMERAKRKADELQEKVRLEQEKARDAIESSERQKEQEVTSIIEEAVKSAVLTNINGTLPDVDLLQTSQPPPTPKPSLQRPPSHKGLLRGAPEIPRLPLVRRGSSVVSTSTEVNAESWRSKAPPPISTPQLTAKLSVPAFIPPLPSALDQADIDLIQEELEVVEFSELGKFVGAEETPDLSPPVAEVNSRPQRPVASDFFEDRPPLQEAETWRRRSSHDVVQAHQVASSSNENKPDIPASAKYNGTDVITVADADVHSSSYSILPASLSKAAALPAEHHIVAEHDHITDHHHVAGHGQPSGISQLQSRLSRGQLFYKEAAMSALDDAMSRIKGALDGMHPNDLHREQQHHVDVTEPDKQEIPLTSTQPVFVPPPSRPQPPKERWIPPALRIAREYDSDQRPREAFAITGCDPPRSPKPAWSTFVVRLPSESQSLEPLNKRQIHLSRSPMPFRWDVLSWDPPVEGMNRRDFSINEVLFRKLPTFKGKHKYRVVLPRFRAYMSGPKVNLPANSALSKINGIGAFGRPKGADDLSTWRKAPPPVVNKVEMTDAGVSDSGLSTTSRSPPPEFTTEATAASLGDASISSVKPDGPPAPPRSRSQPKMPAGSAVAFYRGSRIDVVEAEPKPSVSFIVSSELAEDRRTVDSVSANVQPTIVVSSPLPPSSSHTDLETKKPDVEHHPEINGLKSQPSSPELASPSLTQSKTESKSSDDTTDHPVTPPSRHPSATWSKSSLGFPSKDSPARGPDPEHLKAVWSQASNKARLPAVNSLEGIADDLTALPFTLQDVKSEDGETPPPSTSVPRMSLHDVTRAFQQVPSSSSSNSNIHSVASRSPTSSAAPPVRNPGYMYAVPTAPNPNMRPAYVQYPSPMLSHSPSPTVMYPHPMATSPGANRMPINGHAPMYGQPMWMPVPGTSAQGHNGMMRPLSSPYPAQLMSYPSPGATSMYPLPPTHPPQQNSGPQNRGRGMPSMMSPVIPHAHVPHTNVAMYPGSPVMMHAPGMPPSYMTMPGGRGQPRGDNITPHSPMQHSSPYTPVPATSFARTNW